MVHPFGLPLFLTNSFIFSPFGLLTEFLVGDCAISLRDNGKYRIGRFGKFEVSKRTGKIVFTPYQSFLDKMEFTDQYTGDIEDDDD